MGFSILQWNSRSIFKKWHEFKNYLSALDDLPDVLCIQESHLTPKYQPSIPHYQVIRKNRPLSKGKGGGIAIGYPERHMRKASHCGSKQQ